MTIFLGLGTGTWALLGAAALGLVLAFYFVIVYNRLVALRNRYRNGFSQIDVQLKRRYDLIPNLVEAVKGYMSHERETLEAVMRARAAAVSAGGAAAAKPGDPAAMKALNGAEGALGGALSRMMLLVENYPDLKANQNMAQFQEELTSTENKIAFSRQAYNDAVMVYNTRVESFPDMVIAVPAGFRRAGFFEIEAPEQREAPKASFS